MRTGAAMSVNKFFSARASSFIAVLSIGVFLALSAGCARSPQARRDKFLAAGKRQMEKKDYDRAVLEFKNAIRAMPKDAEAYYQLGMASAASGHAQDAYFSLKKAVELDPNHSMAKLRLAQLLASARDPNVVKTGEEQLKNLPGADSNPDILTSMALAHLKLGETDDAIQTLTKSLTQSPKELSASILLATANLTKGDVKAAEDVLKQACASNPASPYPYIILGEFYRSRGSGQDALAQFTRALQIAPKNSTALLDLALVQSAAGLKGEAEKSFQRLATSGDKRYKAAHALFLLREKRTDDAIGELERMVKADPSDRTIRTDLVAAYELANRRSDADRILTAALKKDTEDVDALLQEAELLEVDRKYDQAERDLNEVLRLKPDSAELHFTKAKLEDAMGQPLVEREELKEAVRLDPNLLLARLKLAEILNHEKDPKSALAVLDEAPKNQKGSASWSTEHNWTLWAAGDITKMRQGVEDGLKAGRTSDLLLQDGLLKIYAKNLPAAQKSLEEALKVNPADIRPLELLGRTYRAEKADKTAVETVKKYASEQPKSVEMQELLGMALMRSGDRPGARAAYLAAKADNPNYTLADFSLVQVDLVESKVEDARKRLTALIASDSRDTRAHLWLGIIEQATGNKPAAIDEFRKCVQSDGQNAQALNNLAYLLTDYADKPDEALPYAQKARELNPSDPEYADTLGWVFYRKGLYASAIKQMEAATSVRQTEAVFKYHLAMAYAKSGDATKGKSMLQAALKLNPSLPEASAAQKVFVEAGANRATP